MKYKSLMLAAALALPLSAHASGSPVPSVLFFPLVVIGAIAELFSGSPRPEPEAEAESVAQPPANSPSPLVFNATEKCPPFVVNPDIARRAQEKRRADELEYARLIEDNVPAAPIYSGLDGGMNKAFLARFPYRVTLAKVMPYASYLPQLPPVPWTDNDGSLTSKWFGSSFSKPVVCDATRAGGTSGRC